MPLAVQRSRHGSAVEGAKHLLHRAEAASTSLAERKSEEQEAARKQHHKSNELGFTAAHGRRITVSDIEKTNRGQRIEGVAAISHAAERSKHATAKETVTKNDVKEFLAGHSWAPTADDEDLGLTWIANSSVASQSASPRKSLSTREIDATRAALEAAPVVRTAAQRLLVRALLGSVDLFSNLTRAEIDALSEVVAVETVADGDIIMTEGEPGEEFCIILSGSVDIFIGGRHVRRAKRKQRARSRTTVYGNGARRPDETSPTNRRPRLISDAGTVSSPDGSPPGSPRAGSPRAAGPTWAEGFDGQLTRRNVNEDDERVVKATMTAEELKEYDGVRVGQMGVGATFGELALLNENGVRSATAVAVGETTLVQVARSDFTKLVAELIQQKNESRMSVLQKTYAFGAWSTERMIKLCSFLLPFTFSRNTVIAAETSAISTVFIVTDGTVRLQKTIEDDEVIGVPTSGGSKDEASQQPQPQGQQLPPTERKRKPARHQVYSPRPRNNTADAPTIEVALLGPGAILGDVELAAGSRVYKGTYVATSEIHGFKIKASEFMNRLDPTTLHTLQTVSVEVLRDRNERVAAAALRTKQQSKSATTAVKPVRPASAPPRVDRRDPPTPRRGLLGLHISLRLSPGGSAFPVDPLEGWRRDADDRLKNQKGFMLDASPAATDDISTSTTITISRHNHKHIHHHKHHHRYYSSGGCPVCFEQYRSDESGLRVPRILTSCGHTVCHGCIASALKAVRMKGDVKKFECPTCAAVTEVKKGAADTLLQSQRPPPQPPAQATVQKKNGGRRRRPHTAGPSVGSAGRTVAAHGHAGERATPTPPSAAKHATVIDADPVLGGLTEVTSAAQLRDRVRQKELTEAAKTKTAARDRRS